MSLRTAFAWFLVVSTLVLWPVSMVTFAKDEPPAVLSLSWFAITLTAWDVLHTAKVRDTQDEKS